MAYSQDEINSAYMELINRGFSPEAAEGYLRGVLDQQQAAPAPAPMDPRVEEMWNVWNEAQQLNAYDATIAQIVNDPRNADINPNRYHLYVSAAGGDFDRALELYRSDVANLLEDYGIDPTKAPGYVEQTGPQSVQPIDGEDPRDKLHRQIDDLMAWRRQQQGR